MNNEKQLGNLEIALEYISDDNDSLGQNDFKTTTKLISLMPNGISFEKFNQNNNKNNNFLYKKNTKISSNNEDIYSETDNQNKYINNQLTDNDNIDNIDNLKSPTKNNLNNSDNNLIVVIKKNKYLLEIQNSPGSNSSLNKYDKLNNSENNHISYYNDDNENLSLKKKSSFSPIKKRRKIICEEKKKNRGLKKSVYAIEPKEEEKKEEEEKKYREDKNGTVICKKNKKKVKIGFLEPLAKIIPIQSYKEYNAMENMPKGKRFIDSKETCLCCSIF